MIINFHHTIQEFILDDSIHLILFFTLLSTFYFFYVTKEEEHAQIEVVKSLININPSDNTFINNIISKIITNYPNILSDLKAKSEQLERERYEKNLIFKKRTYYGISILLLILVLVNIIVKLYYKKKYMASLTKSLISNIISVLILGGVEFIFFIYIVKRYHRMDKETLIYKLLKEFK